jgi:type IV secretory pathway component VirB8
MTWRRRLDDLARQTPEIFMVAALAAMLGAAAAILTIVLLVV